MLNVCFNQHTDTLCTLLWIYASYFFAMTSANTTASSSNVTTTTVATTTEFNFLYFFPQSAISLVSLAGFIGLSIVVAILAERCYERLSIRDDSSDMSEHTKEILRARILGMVFGKKLKLSDLSDKQRQSELAKKYAHLWQYKAAMKRQRRLHQQKERKRKSSVFSGFFSKQEDSSEEKARPQSGKKLSLAKKPSQPSIMEVSPSKEKGKDSVTIDLKLSSSKKQTGKATLVKNQSNDHITIEMGNISTPKQPNNSLSEVKAKPVPKSPGRPLTAGRSRPITAGAKRAPTPVKPMAK